VRSSALLANTRHTTRVYTESLQSTFNDLNR
jgi:hypothetical protein